jgi:uncharacterized protein involved in exopolysaccharide biosynthesis
MNFRLKSFPALALLLAGVALFGAGLWLLLSPAQYLATARIKIQPDSEDVNGNEQGMAYDPYFLQTYFEIIQSQLVLSNVIATLNLNTQWADKFGGGTPLKTLESVRIIKNHLRLAPVRNTKFILISYQSDDPNEAATMANAIGKAFKDFWIAARRQTITNGRQIFTEQFQKEVTVIKTMQEQLEQMRTQLNVPAPEPPDELLKSNFPAFFQTKQELQARLDLHQLRGAKIEALKIDSSRPASSPVQIIDPAEPPKSPVSPNRLLGAALFAIGLASSICGAVRLKPSGRLAPCRE